MCFKNGEEGTVDFRCNTIIKVILFNDVYQFWTMYVRHYFSLCFFTSMITIFISKLTYEGLLYVCKFLNHMKDKTNNFNFFLFEGACSATQNLRFPLLLLLRIYSIYLATKWTLTKHSNLMPMLFSRPLSPHQHSSWYYNNKF